MPSLRVPILLPGQGLGLDCPSGTPCIALGFEFRERRVCFWKEGCLGSRVSPGNADLMCRFPSGKPEGHGRS